MTGNPHCGFQWEVLLDWFMAIAPAPAELRRTRLRKRMLPAILFALPFILLAVATLLGGWMKVPPLERMPGMLSKAELIGLDASGNSYLQQLDDSEYPLVCIDRRGRERWKLPVRRQLDIEWSPLIDLMQQQDDGVCVFQSREGQLLAVQPDGSFAWRFDPYTTPGLTGLEDPFTSPHPAEQVPPFTYWHDQFSTLYAVDYGGRLLWTAEALADGSEGQFSVGRRAYGKDDWSDGSLLVTVDYSAMLSGSYKGEYMLRRLARNGSYENLWRMDVHGNHSPPVPVGDTVLCYEGRAGRGLQIFSSSGQHRGYQVPGNDCWQLGPDAYYLWESGRGLGCYSLERKLQWHVPQRGMMARLEVDPQGRCYILGSAMQQDSIVAEALSDKLWMRELFRKLGLDYHARHTGIRCYSREGVELWQQRIRGEYSDMAIHAVDGWLAVESGEDLLLYRTGSIGN